YLTAPAMTIQPLKTAVGLLACALGARAALAGIALAATLAGLSGTVGTSAATTSALFLAMRWGMGFLAAAIASYMTWKSAEIRSTQSATGILYIAMIFVLFGELSSLVMAGQNAIIC